jgi:hypothetical protein
MSKKPCFFGSKYSGEKCVCGWESKMEKELPIGYQPSSNGIIKLFVQNVYDKPRPATTYSCVNKNAVQKRGNSQEPLPKHQTFMVYHAVKRNNSQEPLPKHPTFMVYHDTNRVLPKGAWSETIRNYIRCALVRKEQRPGFLTCIGVASPDEAEEGVYWFHLITDRSVYSSN